MTPSPRFLHELDTPALVVDLDIMERNLRHMADYAAGHGLRLRPHTKTHKIPALAMRQIALGAAGISVAKPGEAEVMLAAQPPDLLVAYPTFGPQKLARLMEVARRTRLAMAIDSIEIAEAISRAAVGAGVTVGLLVEVDVGLHRVGVPPDHAAALAAAIERLPGVEWDGIAFYPGHIKSLDPAGLAAIGHLSETVGTLAAALQPKIVSGGSTPTWAHSHLVSGMNEMRPGTYIFNDRNSVAIGSCVWDDCAASVLTTVVSTAVAGQAIIDGGSKTFSSDRLVGSSEVTFGEVLEAPGAVFHKMMEEHGFLDVSACQRPLNLGDRVRIIPNHICVAVNLHERVYGVRGDRVEEIWTVDGRGKLQ
jgi:D-serine deaminase-like pyridoxal phosphate-dependent protein